MLSLQSVSYPVAVLRMWNDMPLDELELGSPPQGTKSVTSHFTDVDCRMQAPSSPSWRGLRTAADESGAARSAARPKKDMLA